MLASAFQILHFRQYLELSKPPREAIDAKITELNATPSPELMQEIELSEEYFQLMNQYEEYTKLTLAGEHGSTAQFWMKYVQYVHLYLRLSRACKTNDIELFIYALAEMIPLFFATNRPNYSRWMVRYVLNLLNVDTTHPGIKEVLANGALSIKRTSKPFSRTPIDMALEQTINADAASRMTGIASFSTSVNARSRWMVTRSVRSYIVSVLMGKADLVSKEDVTKDLKAHRITKDNGDVMKLVDGINNLMNPFTQEISSANLYNIATGKKVGDDVKVDMLECYSKGKEWCQEFKEGCFADPSRFERPIKRRKVKNFAANMIKKTTGKDNKVRELQGTRDLFGRLLYLSTVENIDLPMVFQYPLTPVPLSLAHVDGCMNKTNKATLTTKIENMVTSKKPDAKPDVLIVDVMFYLHTLNNPASTYGAIAGTLLRNICNMATQIHFVSDRYLTPSIKDIEHQKRGADEELIITITGKDQTRPKNWQEALASTSFKTELIRFLSREWENDAYAKTLAGHTVFLTVDTKCYVFTAHYNGKVNKTEVAELECQHEEADTRMIFHLYHIVSTTDSSTKINVRCNDTDVFILLMYHMAQMSEIHGFMPKVWLDIGLSGKNSRRYIELHLLVDTLDNALINALPGYHAFTGCDYTASFMNKGKKRPLDLMLKRELFTDAFRSLGEEENVSEDTCAALEIYVCALYGKHKQVKVDKARYLIFQQRYAPKKKSDPLERIKGINPSSIPPCCAVLMNKIKRANLVTTIWKNAALANPSTLNPESNGWFVDDGYYAIRWYDGNQVPQSVSAVLETQCRVTEDEEVDDVTYDEDLYGSDESDNSDDDE